MGHAKYCRQRRQQRAQEKQLAVALAANQAEEARCEAAAQAARELEARQEAERQIALAETLAAIEARRARQPDLTEIFAKIDTVGQIACRARLGAIPSSVAVQGGIN